jgi:hypothetical protein
LAGIINLSSAFRSIAHVDGGGKHLSGTLTIKFVYNPRDSTTVGLPTEWNLECR